MEYLKLPPEAFFNHLKDETEKAYDNSPVKKFKLYYSICGTSIKREKGVLFGLNWGGKYEIGKEYKAQLHMPNDESLKKDDPDTYLFTKKLLPYLGFYKGIKSINEINYTNLCFFRSTKIEDLEKDDWDRSSRLFKELVEYINPAWIIFTSIGKSSITRLSTISDFEMIQYQKFNQDNKVFTAYKGKYRKSVNLYTVPYPYRAGGINDDTRRAIWNWLFPKNI